MARTRQLQEIRADAYKLADEESNTSRFPTSEVDRYVNEGIAYVWDLLIQVLGRSYCEKATPQDIPSTTSKSYSLSTDFYKIVSVRLIDGSNSFNFEPFEDTEEAYLEDTVLSPSGNPAFYQVRGTTPAVLYVLPAPTAGKVIRVRYVPYATELASPTATFDGINGYEKLVAIYAAIQMATKNVDGDCLASLDRLWALEEKRVRRSAKNRDLTHPPRIQDVRGLRVQRRFARWRP